MWKNALLALIASGPLVAWAEVSQVNLWDPLPGKGAQTFENAMAAKRIHEKNGARVWIGSDQLGRLHYVVSFDTWADWAKFNAAMQQSKEWNDWWSQVTQDPSAELTEVYMVEEVSGEAE